MTLKRQDLEDERTLSHYDRGVGDFWKGTRDHDLEARRGFMTAAGFAELEHYYRPEGLPRERQPWLASVWRKR